MSKFLEDDLMVQLVRSKLSGKSLYEDDQSANSHIANWTALGLNTYCNEIADIVDKADNACRALVKVGNELESLAKHIKTLHGSDSAKIKKMIGGLKMELADAKSYYKDEHVKAIANAAAATKSLGAKLQSIEDFINKLKSLV